jgi:hypothetical protein
MLVFIQKVIPIGLGVMIFAQIPDNAPRMQPPKPPSLQWMGANEPLSFEENRGQFDGPARFVAHSEGFALSLQPAEAVMKLKGQRPEDPSVAVRMALDGCRADARLRGRDELPGRSHYLRGSDPTKWVRDVPSYAKVEYEDVYPGINLVFRGDGKQLEYDFVVASGADPTQVRLSFEGIDRAQVDASGDLVLETGAGAVRQHRPLLYQEIGGRRHEVAGGFWLHGPSEVGFSVGAYDTAQPLVIDPAVVYSTFAAGGRGYQGIQDVAVDAEGNSYEVLEYPWDSDRGSPDMRVLKRSPTGVSLSGTAIGGTWADVPTAVAIDAAGNIYLTGFTDSTRCCRSFPVTAGAFQLDNAGGRDAFVIKLDPAGRTLLYSSFLGGTGNDLGADIEVDDKGRIYVTGKTTSTDFPTANPWQASLAGGSDAFLTILEPNGASVVSSTYLGGTSDEAVARMALFEHEAIIFGTTSSLDFPARNNSIQPAFAGGASDAFIAVLTSGGGLKDATYLGGSGKDDAFGVAIDGAGFLYLAGSTDSPDFPTATPLSAQQGSARRRNSARSSSSSTATALQPRLSFPPEADAFLAKVDPKLSSLAYSTYLDVGRDASCFKYPTYVPCGGVAVDTGSNAYVTAGNVFAIRVDAGGNNRIFTFNGFGGQAIALRNMLDAPEILVAGRTQSFYFPTFNATNSTYRYYYSDAGFMTKLSGGPNPGATLEENDPSITYAGTWETDVSPEHSGGAALRSAEAGAKATITFTGTGIQVIGRRDPASGFAIVGQNWDFNFPRGSVDTYSWQAEPRSLLVSFSGLPQGTHTVTLEVNGTRNNRSTGDWVTIDGINVLGAP